MLTINYNAKWEAIKHYNNFTTITIPEDFYIDANTIYEISLNTNLSLPEGVTAKCQLNQNLPQCLIMLPGSIETTDNIVIRIYNPTKEDIKLTKNLDLLRLELYKQSITLSSVNYDKSEDKCSFSIDNLETSIVKIPESQLQFHNLMKDESA